MSDNVIGMAVEKELRTQKEHIRQANATNRNLVMQNTKLIAQVEDFQSRITTLVMSANEFRAKCAGAITTLHAMASELVERAQGGQAVAPEKLAQYKSKLDSMLLVAAEDASGRVQ